MSERPTLLETLRTTSLMLKSVRQMLSDSGHLPSVTEIDTLINVTEAEADRHANKEAARRKLENLTRQDDAETDLPQLALRRSS